MAHQKCFGSVSDNLNSGDYISRKKAKTIYKNAVNLANQGGVSHKKTPSGQNKGTYVGNIYIGKDKCLVGAKDYDSLLSVTNGKYLVNPSTLDIRSKQDLWTGSIYAMDMSGVTSIIAYPDGSGNTFIYPPHITANQTYPNNIPPSDQGLIVDPSYNIFYKEDVTQSARGVCYLKNERAYKQYLKCLPYTQAIAKTYLEVSNGYIGEYFYPKKFSFHCRNELWRLFVSHCGGKFVGLDISQFNIYIAVQLWIHNQPVAEAIFGNISNWDTSKITDMSYLFDGATYFNDDISNWDTSSVTNMTGMFEDASAFNQNINTIGSKWDTSNVTNMSYMFNGAHDFNGNIVDWDTHQVTTMSWMFRDAHDFNKDINRVGSGPGTKWDTQNVTHMTNMFIRAHLFNGDISNWDTGNVTTMWNMFSGAVTFNKNISNWNTIAVKNMTAMFSSAYAFNNEGITLNTWDTTNVTNMSYMFQNAYAFDQAISNWVTSSVKDMSYMFQNAYVFDQNISFGGGGIWDTSNVEDMSYMFDHASAFNGTVSGWDTSKVKNMTAMFDYALVFNQDINTGVGWDTGAVTTMTAMFRNASAFNNGVSTLNSWDTSKVTDMTNMFIRAIAFNQDISSWVTSSVTSMQNMFDGGPSGNVFNGDITGWNTSSVTTMNQMFAKAVVFDQNITVWNVDLVTDFTNMFLSANAMTSTYSTTVGYGVTPTPAFFNSTYTATGLYTESIVGSNVTLTFTGGTGGLTFHQAISVTYVVVAGGQDGSGTTGGNGGQVLTATFTSGIEDLLTITVGAATDDSIIVGAPLGTITATSGSGGAGGAAGDDGGNGLLGYGGGGGGGQTDLFSPAAGYGTDGGGNGAQYAAPTSNGETNKGGGGGGQSGAGFPPPGNGGSGVVTFSFTMP